MGFRICGRGYLVVKSSPLCALWRLSILSALERRLRVCLIMGWVCLCMLGNGNGIGSSPEPAPEKGRWKVIAGPVDVSVRYRCCRLPMTRIPLYCPRSGVVQSVVVRSGQEVKSGEVLVSLEKENKASSETDRLLRAPAQGRVLDVLCQPGTRVVGTGVFVPPTEVILFAADGPSGFQLSLHPKEVERIQKAQRVLLEIPPAEPREAKVSFEPEGASRTRIFVNTDPDVGSEPGTDAFVCFILDSSEGVRVPCSALKLQSGQLGVWLSTEDGLEFRLISLGLVNETWAQILEGLSEGDTILWEEKP